MLWIYLVLITFSEANIKQDLKFLIDKNFFLYDDVRWSLFRFTNVSFDASEYNYTLQACRANSETFYCKCNSSSAPCNNFRVDAVGKCNVKDRNGVMCSLKYFKLAVTYAIRLKVVGYETFIEYFQPAYVIMTCANNWNCYGFSLGVKLDISSTGTGFSVDFKWVNNLPKLIEENQMVIIKYRKSNETKSKLKQIFSYNQTTKNKGSMVDTSDLCSNYTICAFVKNRQCREYKNGSQISVSNCQTVSHGNKCDNQHSELARRENEDLNKAVIIGIILGCVCLICLITGPLLWCKFFRGREERRNANNEDSLWVLEPSFET